MDSSSFKESTISGKQDRSKSPLSPKTDDNTRAQQVPRVVA
jgi:hypothetical protein